VLLSNLKNVYLCGNYYIMETTKKSIFKPVDEIVRLMKESKRQSKIESQEFLKSKEFQEMLTRLRAKKINENAI